MNNLSVFLVLLICQPLPGQTFPPEDVRARRLEMLQEGPMEVKSASASAHAGPISRFDPLRMILMPEMKKRSNAPLGELPERASALAKTESPQATLHVIDTAYVYTPFDTIRHIYSFNARGRMASKTVQTLSGEAWTDHDRDTWMYDVNGNMITHVQWYWFNGQFVNTERYTWTYEANGNMLTELNEYCIDGQWVNYWRHTYAYDASGNMLTELYEGWSDGQWATPERHTYTYDASGNMLTDLSEGWSDGQWVNYWRITYTYDASGNMITELHEGWRDGQWANHWRWTYSYDAGGNMLTDLYEDWNNGQWVNYERWTYTYDASGNMLTDLLEHWSNDLWVNAVHFSYAYDTRGNVLTDLLENWSNNQWVNIRCLTRTYDASGNVTSVFSSPAYSVRGGWQMTDNAGNVYSFNHFLTLVFVYHELTDDVATYGSTLPRQSALDQNYPNPFNPTTKIGYTIGVTGGQSPVDRNVKLAVYDLLGREVAVLVNEKKEPGDYSVTWDARGMASGVYFYRLQAGDFVQTRKLLNLK